MIYRDISRLSLVIATTSRVARLRYISADKIGRCAPDGTGSDRSIADYIRRDLAAPIHGDRYSLEYWRSALLIRSPVQIMRAIRAGADGRRREGTAANEKAPGRACRGSFTECRRPVRLWAILGYQRWMARCRVARLTGSGRREDARQGNDDEDADAAGS